MFIDYVEITIRSGKGGDGMVAFRREKYVPKGGPAGGNGGEGGDIIFRTNPQLTTLLDLRYKKIYEAGDGAKGGSSLKDGKNGETLYIDVPVGTMLKDTESEEIIADLNEPGIEFTAAKGGRGGKGNANFTTPTNRAPRYAETGRAGQEFSIALELKLIADVGLVGLPNAGKSTLISSISRAKPKIADYPFTTLVPNLGIVNYKEYKSFVMADIPGIIEGAHEGKGLGLQFLRHIERTKILLVMIESLTDDIKDTYKVLEKELANYSKELSKKPRYVAITKNDLADDDLKKKLSKLKLGGYKGKVFIISAVSGEGISGLLDELWQEIQKCS